MHFPLNGSTEDFLIFDFKDIDGSEYSCRISIDRSFAILQYTKNEEDEFELMDTLDISGEVL